MSFRRVAGLAVAAISIVLWVSCGQVYRPVVIPQPSTPPNPANFHQVFAISTNVASSPGTALQIDVAGDSNIGVGNMGNPMALNLVKAGHSLLVHDIRRTAVRNLRRLGFTEKTIMEISGHKSPAVFKRYDIVDETDLDEVAAALDRKYLSQLSHNLLPVKKQRQGEHQQELKIQ